MLCLNKGISFDEALVVEKKKAVNNRKKAQKVKGLKDVGTVFPSRAAAMGIAYPTGTMGLRKTKRGKTVEEPGHSTCI